LQFPVIKELHFVCESSDRLSRIAQVWSCALDVWQNDEDARAFLNRPHAMLDGRTPMGAALKTEAGARMIEDILGRLKHGTAA
jgi:putative toxin-antitoxin system antitoxin component (TIGR02293 family)